MDWLEEAEGRISRKNQVLFAKDSAYLQELSRLIQQQNHRTMVLWAFELAEEAVDTLNARYPDEDRPGQALLQSQNWASGLVKMPVAQRAILGVHAFAKEIASPEDIALCHAIGHACGTVHTAGHAIGFPIYELTAIIRRHGVPGCRAPVEERMGQYVARIRYWKENQARYTGQWAGFMLSSSL